MRLYNTNLDVVRTRYFALKHGATIDAPEVKFGIFVCRNDDIYRLMQSLPINGEVPHAQELPDEAVLVVRKSELSALISTEEICAINDEVIVRSVSPPAPTDVQKGAFVSETELRSLISAGEHLTAGHPSKKQATDGVALSDTDLSLIGLSRREWDLLSPEQQGEARLSIEATRNNYELVVAQREARIACGRYTLQEAAELIGSTGERVDVFVEKLCQAAIQGNLPTHAPGEQARYQYGAMTKARSYYEEAYWDGLNAWLGAHEPRITFRFAQPSTSRNAPALPDATVIIGSEPQAIPSTSIASLFHGLYWDDEKWSIYLADPPKWLATARVSRGTKGVGRAATWNPVTVAVLLLDKKISLAKLDAVFKKSATKAWVSEWEEKSSYLRA